MYVGTSSHTYGVATYLLTYLLTHPEAAGKGNCVCVCGGGDGAETREEKKCHVSGGLGHLCTHRVYTHTSTSTYLL